MKVKGFLNFALKFDICILDNSLILNLKAFHQKMEVIALKFLLNFWEHFEKSLYDSIFSLIFYFGICTLIRAKYYMYVSRYVCSNLFAYLPFSFFLSFLSFPVYLSHSYCLISFFLSLSLSLSIYLSIYQSIYLC